MPRIKGQETSVIVTSTTNGVEPSFNDVRSLEVTFSREILTEGYLGQTTEKKDDIFNGVNGTIEFHQESSDIMNLIDRINLVSKRRLPGESVSIVSTFRFPTGLTYRVIMSDCKFGDIPITVGSRKDFVTFKLDFASDDATFLPTV